ncbi:MAG TPA: winged helix-turn-helix domain-containing protein [Candidatus Acidoferrum sp.]|nr:winged helix-turn-helix domain-containing protein [Candidatus Acidoferrum sp.]
MAAPGARYRFGPFELLPRSRELLKEGRRIKVRPQPLQVLEVLLERGGDVVTREELRERVWQADTFVDFEHGLNTAIKELRAVLNDSATAPRYIETMPKVGYRMIEEVEAQVAEGSAKKVIKLGEPAAPIRDFVWSGESGWTGVERKKPEEKPRTSRAGWVAGAVVGILVVAGIVFGVKWVQGREAAKREAVRLAAARNGRVMLAVLPFQNLTGDAGQEYLSDGLTEEMIAQLGLMDPEHFGVIARTSVMHYKNIQENAAQIGRELGVQYVLEGSVRRDAERVRITAQLVRAGDQTRLWTKEFDRELQSLLAVQSEIALETADEIQQTLGTKKLVAAKPKLAMSREGYEAYDQYLKGLYFLNRRTLPGFEQAVACFREAIRKNPQSAAAYAGLANTYTLLSGYTLSPASKYMPRARAAALRALELDDKLPEAHTALALIVQNYDWDWQTAEKEFKRSIELNPNYATAHHWYAEHLGFRGRFEEAFKESDEAKRLDPLSLIIATDRGVLFYFARDYDRAIEQLRVVLDMDPAFPHAHMIEFAYAGKGQYAKALADIEDGKRMMGGDPWYWSAKARIYGQWGHQTQALNALEKMKEMSEKHSLDAAPLAWAHLGMGQREEGLNWLEQAYEQHSNAMTALKVDPIYDIVRNDPRFQDLLRRVGLGD